MISLKISPCKSQTLPSEHPNSTDREDNPPTMPCCWQEPWEPTECVIQRDLKGVLYKPTPLASSHSQLKHTYAVSVAERSSVYPQGHRKLKRPKVKWPKTAMPGFCQYWLFHVGFCSGAVDGKVCRDTHRMKLIFSMKAWLCWSCWEFWN